VNDFIKTFLVLLCVSGSVLAADTNELVFGVLHTAQGDYNHARIIRVTPAYAVVSHDGGLTKVALTNLPEFYQQKFNYDPQKAADFLAGEQQKQIDTLNTRVEAQRRLAAQRGTNQFIKITVILDAFGQCQIDSAAGPQKAYVMGIPNSVKDFLNQLAQAPVDIQNCKQQISDLKAALVQAENRTAKAIALGTDADYVNASTAENNLRANIRDAGNKLDGLNSNYESLKAALDSSTTIVAFPTGQSHTGLPLWLAVGPAPQKSATGP
jgi:hypothetical protein